MLNRVIAVVSKSIVLTLRVARLLLVRTVIRNVLMVAPEKDKNT